jgi:hypothetical protein
VSSGCFAWQQRQQQQQHPSGTTFNRMVDVMNQIVEAAAAL